jgi:hypothetical protein
MAQVKNWTYDANGQVVVSYDDGTKRTFTPKDAIIAGIIKDPGSMGASGKVTPTVTKEEKAAAEAAATASGTTLAGSYGTDGSGAFAYVDPSTGTSVSGAGTVPTANGVKTISELIIGARNPKNLAAIRNALIANGIIGKNVKSLTSIQNAWLTVVTGAATTQMDPFKYMQDLKSGGFGQDTAVGQTNKPYAQATIWKEDKAQAFVIEQYKSLLNREPTPAELAKEASTIIAQQKKPSSETITKYTDKNGVTHAQTTGGFDETQFITNKLKNTDEYKNLQKDLNSVAVQELKGIAADNGVRLNDTQIVDWAKRLAGGESPEIFKTTIRGIAKLGQPEAVKKLLDQGVDLSTVYQPYKQSMANVLGINANTISLDDPTLRSAIKAEGEMTIYDFQKSLRQDNRWKYSQEANNEVSAMVNQVKRDFGFMG